MSRGRTLPHEFSFRDVDCVACGGDATDRLGRRNPRSYDLDESLVVTVVRCRNCRMVFPKPFPIPSPGAQSEKFSHPEDYFPGAIDVERERAYDERVKWLLPHIPEGGNTLLDFGCGRGEMLAAAARAGLVATGYDISPVFANIASKRTKARVLIGPAELSHQPPASFDAATMVSTLHHTQDPLAELKTVRALLKNGCPLYIEVMNQDSLLYLAGDLYYRLLGLDLTIRLSPTFPSYELWGFTRRSIELLLGRAGFSVAGMRIRGGVSSTLGLHPTSLKESVVRFGMRQIMRFADLVGSGQVLELVAVKT